MMKSRIIIITLLILYKFNISSASNPVKVIFENDDIKLELHNKGVTNLNRANWLSLTCLNKSRSDLKLIELDIYFGDLYRGFNSEGTLFGTWKEGVGSTYKEMRNHQGNLILPPKTIIFSNGSLGDQALIGFYKFSIEDQQIITDVRIELEYEINDKTTKEKFNEQIRFTINHSSLEYESKIILDSIKSLSTKGVLSKTQKYFVRTLMRSEWGNSLISERNLIDFCTTLTNQSLMEAYGYGIKSSFLKELKKRGCTPNKEFSEYFAKVITERKYIKPWILIDYWDNSFIDLMIKNQSDLMSFTNEIESHAVAWKDSTVFCSKIYSYLDSINAFKNIHLETAESEYHWFKSIKLLASTRDSNAIQKLNEMLDDRQKVSLCYSDNGITNETVETRVCDVVFQELLKAANLTILNSHPFGGSYLYAKQQVFYLLNEQPKQFYENTDYRLFKSTWTPYYIATYYPLTDARKNDLRKILLAL